MNVRRIRVCVALALAVAAGVLPTVATAHGTEAFALRNGLPDQGFTWAAAYAQRIANLAESRDSGYSAVKVTPPKEYLEVWWKGRLDQDVADLVDEARKAGVVVDVRPAVRSNADVIRAGERVIRSPRFREAGIDVTAIESPIDGSVFDVTYRPTDKKTTPEEQRASAKSMVEEESGVPVRSIKEGAPEPLATRDDDDASFAGGWKAGGLIVSTQNGLSNNTDYWYRRHVCSTGFAVTLNGVNSPGDVARILTALHCLKRSASGQVSYGSLGFYDGSYRRTDEPDATGWDVFAHSADNTVSTGSAPIGTAFAQDAAILNPVGPTTGKVWYGPWNADQYSLFIIKGRASNVRGTIIYTSGANSGENTGVIDDATAVTWTCGDFQCQNGVKAHSADYTVLAANIDSGGPVYMAASLVDPNAGVTDVKSLGIISAGINSSIVSCSGSNLRFTGQNCFQEIYYSSINQIYSAFMNTTHQFEVNSD
jgi:hypothetical protein